MISYIISTTLCNTNENILFFSKQFVVLCQKSEINNSLKVALETNKGYMIMTRKYFYAIAFFISIGFADIIVNSPSNKLLF